jgi:heme-degrading monooxygenase HmoA
VVRIAYRFRVDPERLDEFRTAWREATEIIRRTRPGARGSTLLVNADDPSQVLLLALWESRDHWQAARDADSAAPEQEAVMLEIGRPEGATVYELLDELADAVHPAGTEPSAGR